MQSPKSPSDGQFSHDYSWIECVFYSPDSSRIDAEKLSILAEKFGSLVVVSFDERMQGIYSEVQWHQYDADQSGKAEIWNQMLSNSKKDWVLFLEADEDLRFYRLPQRKNLKPDRWVPACISHKEEKSEKSNYQVRLIHKSARDPFEGRNLPDCTTYIVQNEIQLLDQPILLPRTSDPYEQVDPEIEMSYKKQTPSVHLLLAERLMEQRKYVQASAHYRNILKIEKLLTFDRLAAVNGLTRCYTEQYKWPKALKLADKSIVAEPAQRIPYLIQYRIHQLNKQWEEAYSSLKTYFGHLNISTRAGYDKSISEDETLELLSELASKAGFKEDAFDYLEEIYADKRGDAGKGLLRKLLMFAIELQKRERAVFYFNQMFEDKILKGRELSDRQESELNDYMTLFMQNQWYVFVADTYEQLYTANPANAEYRRRLIVALSKTNRIERARKLIAI